MSTTPIPGGLLAGLLDHWHSRGWDPTSLATFRMQEGGGEGGGGQGDGGAGSSDAGSGSGGDAGGGQQSPPWGDNFDAERAWKLVQNLRSDLDKVKGDRDTFKTKVDEFENAGKSDLEKATGERDSHKARADTAEGNALRFEVALSKGLTLSQARRLVGTTKEELEKDADELLADLKGSGGDRRPPGGNRRETLRGGGDPTEEPEERDPRKLAARVPRF